jgi:uncharacterized protein YkwD
VARVSRTLLAVIVSGIALLAFSPEASPSETVEQQRLTGREAKLLRALNDVRSDRGLTALRIGTRLRRAARAHSRAMASSGSFGHGDWYRRLRSHGVRSRMLGETLAWGVGSKSTASAIVGAWLASPSHRATILTRGFRWVGVGVAVGTMAGYSGAYVVTADFAG